MVKKFVNAIIDHKNAFKQLTKLDVKEISARLLLMQTYCPSKFARRPRSLEDYVHFIKATEFR